MRISQLLILTRPILACLGMITIIVVNYPLAMAQSGPAFNCNKARTSNEITICRNGELGYLDRQVAQAYSELKSRVSRAARKVTIADQRAWLTARQKCRTDVSCTKQLYTNRLAYLNRELAPYTNNAPAPTQPPAYNPTPISPPAFQPPPTNQPTYQPQTPAYQPPAPTYQPLPPPTNQPAIPTYQPQRPTYQPAPPRQNSPAPFNSSPDRSSHFKTPVSGKSLGGIVREGPGINYRRLRSFRNGRQVSILANSGVRLNGYDWFQISLGGNRTAYQWGGIMCSNGFLLKGINQVCRAQQRPVYTPPPLTRRPTPQFNPPRQQLSDEERDQSICGPGFTFVGDKKRYRGLADRQGCIHTFQVKKKKAKRRCGRSFTYVGFNSGYPANRKGCYRTSLMQRSPKTGKPELCGPGFAHLGKNEECKNIKQWNARQKRKANWPKCPKDFHFVQGRGCTHQSQLGE